MSTTAPVREKTVVTFELPRTLGALVPVETKATVAARIDTALANIAKLEAALEGPYSKRFQASLGPVNRYILEHPRQSMATMVAIPMAVVSGVAVWLTGAWSAGLVGLFPVGVGLALFHGLTTEALARNKADKSTPLATGEVGEAAALLQGMSPSDRALVSVFADETIKNRVAYGWMTSAASELLSDSLAVSGASESDLRAARAGRLVRGLETSGFERKTWKESVSGLLAEHPVEERSELADTLLARFFKDERCTLELEARDGDALYRMLRAAQNAKEPAQD